VTQFGTARATVGGVGPDGDAVRGGPRADPVILDREIALARATVGILRELLLGGEFSESFVDGTDGRQRGAEGNVQ